MAVTTLQLNLKDVKPAGRPWLGNYLEALNTKRLLA